MVCEIVNSTALANISIVMCHIIKLYMESGRERNNSHLNQCMSITSMSVGAITTIKTTTGAVLTYLSYERMLYAVRCLKSNEDMILALAGQFKQLSHEPEKFR